MKDAIGFFRLLPVAHPHTRAANPDFANLAFTQLLTLFRIDDEDVGIFKQSATTNEFP